MKNTLDRLFFSLYDDVMIAEVKRTDIAKKLGIDISTVSRVLNNRQGISGETRKKVLEAAEEQLLSKKEGTFSHRATNGPLVNKTLKLAVVLPNFAGDFFGGILSGIDRVAYASNSIVEIASSSYLAHKESELVDRFVSDGVAGLIVWPLKSDVTHYIDKLRPEMPLIVLDHSVKHDGREIGSVVFDDLKGAGKAVEYLLNLNHRKIGFIGPDPIYSSFSTTQGRISAFRQAIQDRELSEDSLQIGYSERDDNGYSTCMEMLCGSNPPTALFLNDDSMAPQIYSVCRRLGLVIGKDIAVVGFGDQPIATQLEVPLTTVRQNMSMLGEKAAEMLISKVRNPLYKLYDIVLNAPLVVRKSCCHPSGEK